MAARSAALSILAAIVIAGCAEPPSVPIDQYGCSAVQQRLAPCSGQPVRVVGDRPFSVLSAGSAHTCALTAAGAAWCWGSNSSGQIGAPTMELVVRSPVQVAGDHRFTSISAGGEHTCALDDAGAAWCWGRGPHELGVASTADTCHWGYCQRTPVRAVPHLNFVSLKAGQSHTCGITVASETHCWGHNMVGETGNDTLWASHSSAQLVAGNHAFTSLQSRFRFNCALKSQGELYCWGGGDQGQLATLAVPACHQDVLPGGMLCTPTPAAAATTYRFTSIAIGSAFGCGLTLTDILVCWGENGQGQLGRSDTGTRGVVGPVSDVLAEGEWTGVAAGYFHACAVRSTGALYCWGSNSLGALGTGLLRYATEIPQLVQSSVGFIAAAAGVDHTCALTVDGAAWCWGDDRHGQLGQGPS